MASCNFGGKHSTIVDVANSNCIVDYMKDAELQVETEDQREEIIIVLTDLLNSPVDQLKKKNIKIINSSPINGMQFNFFIRILSRRLI
jgi:hypothetical protein